MTSTGTARVYDFFFYDNIKISYRCQLLVKGQHVRNIDEFLMPKNKKYSYEFLISVYLNMACEIKN